MNVKTKILIPSLVAMALMLVLGIVSFYGMRSLQRTLDDVANKGMAHIEILNESRGELFAANVGTYRLFTTMGSFISYGLPAGRDGGSGMLSHRI